MFTGRGSPAQASEPVSRRFIAARRVRADPSRNDGATRRFQLDFDAADYPRENVVQPGGQRAEHHPEHSASRSVLPRRILTQQECLATLRLYVAASLR